MQYIKDQFPYAEYLNRSSHFECDLDICLQIPPKFYMFPLVLSVQVKNSASIHYLYVHLYTYFHMNSRIEMLDRKQWDHNSKIFCALIMKSTQKCVTFIFFSLQ